MSDVDFLIVTSTLDFSTDLVCFELQERGKNYLRLNRDRFNEYKVLFDSQNSSMHIIVDGSEYDILPNRLKSVYFRAPVFLRNLGKPLSLNEQLSKSQWSSFIRNLVVFNATKWINNPVAVYQAENKMLQLSVAQKCGMAIPSTYVGNCLSASIDESSTYIVKALDTALFREGDEEYFTYSTMVSGQELSTSVLQDAPVIVQDYLWNKTDIRTTCIGEKFYSVKITKSGASIEGDWRKNNKENLEYVPIEIPQSIQNKLSHIMNILGLSFGGIDLALVDEEYFFIEVNPTGEWGWLTTVAGLPIDKSIVDLMEGVHSDE